MNGFKSARSRSWATRFLQILVQQVSTSICEPDHDGSRRPRVDEGSSAWSVTMLANAVRAAGPPLLFGLRLWSAVCLSLYVAFWLELDDAAGVSAALMCQPHLGAALCKGWFRMIGTLVGAKNLAWSCGTLDHVLHKSRAICAAAMRST
jgi:hypothetical protein